MHRRRLAVTTGLALLASVLAATGLTHGTAAADTSTTPDPSPTPAVGRHDIGKLVVDNTGARVAVSVYHRGARWTGWDSIGIDTTGTSEPDYMATIPHGTSGSHFAGPGGKPWTCQTRTVFEPPAQCSDDGVDAPLLPVRRASDAGHRRGAFATPDVGRRHVGFDQRADSPQHPGRDGRRHA